MGIGHASYLLASFETHPRHRTDMEDDDGSKINRTI